MALSSCGGGPASVGATIRVLPDPVLFQLMTPESHPGLVEVPNVKAFFHAHITANGLLRVESLDLHVTRKADGAVYTETLDAEKVAYGTTRMAAGDRQRWEIPLHLNAPFTVPSEGREFTLKMVAKLAVKASDEPLELTVEPGLVEDR